MNSDKLNAVKFLADLMTVNGLTSLEVRDAELEVKLERGQAVAVQAVSEPAMPAVSVPAAVPAPQEEPAAQEYNVVVFYTVTELQSPLVGTV